MFEIALLPRTLDAAKRDLTSKRGESRKAALRDLVRHADTDARPDVLACLGRVLSSDASEHVRALAAIAAADAVATELIGELFAALSDSSYRVQQMALLALGEIVTSPTHEQMELVARYWVSDIPALRYQALSTLHRFSQDGALDRLVMAVTDSDVEIRWLAFHLLDEWLCRQNVQNEALPSCERRASSQTRETPPFSNKFVQELFRCAKTDTARNRAEAGLLLLRLSPIDAFQMLRPFFFAPQGLEEGQLERIIGRLGEVNCPDCVPVLRDISQPRWFERKLRWPALVALARMGDELALRVIAGEAQSSSATKRSRASAVIQELRLAVRL